MPQNPASGAHLTPEMSHERAAFVAAISDSRTRSTREEGRRASADRAVRIFTHPRRAVVSTVLPPSDEKPLSAKTTSE